MPPSLPMPDKLLPPVGRLGLCIFVVLMPMLPKFKAWIFLYKDLFLVNIF